MNKKPKKKSNFKKILIAIGVVLVIVFGYFFVQVKKMAKMRESFQVQREAQISFWKEQWLSEEEIQEKLSELRGGQMGGGRVSGPAIGVMRVFGRLTGGRMSHP
jgi:flagellar basal body-associated protein FliL